MIARIALWEPPMTAIVIASLRGRISARRLGLRTVSRFSSVRLLVLLNNENSAAEGDCEARVFGDEPVQRIKRGVETSMLLDRSVECIRTVHFDFCISCNVLASTF